MVAVAANSTFTAPTNRAAGGENSALVRDLPGKKSFAQLLTAGEFGQNSATASRSAPIAKLTGNDPKPAVTQDSNDPTLKKCEPQPQTNSALPVFNPVPIPIPPALDPNASALASPLNLAPEDSSFSHDDQATSGFVISSGSAVPAPASIGAGLLQPTLSCRSGLAKNAIPKTGGTSNEIVATNQSLTDPIMPSSPSLEPAIVPAKNSDDGGNAKHIANERSSIADRSVGLQSAAAGTAVLKPGEAKPSSASSATSKQQISAVGSGKAAPDKAVPDNVGAATPVVADFADLASVTANGLEGSLVDSPAMAEAVAAGKPLVKRVDPAIPSAKRSPNDLTHSSSKDERLNSDETAEATPALSRFAVQPAMKAANNFTLASGDPAAHPVRAAAAAAVVPTPGSLRQDTPQNSAIPATKAQPATPESSSSPEIHLPIPAASLVQSAHVLETVGQSEMRVGLKTANFGNIELRTSVSEGCVGASILTSHSGLREAMIADAPALTRAMATHELQLELHLENQMPGQGGGGSADPGNQAPSRQWQPESVEHPRGGDPGSSGSALPSLSGAQLYSAGLSVHA